MCFYVYDMALFTAMYGARDNRLAISFLAYPNNEGEEDTHEQNNRSLSRVSKQTSNENECFKISFA